MNDKTEAAPAITLRPYRVVNGRLNEPARPVVVRPQGQNHVRAVNAPSRRERREAYRKAGLPWTPLKEVGRVGINREERRKLVRAARRAE